MTDLDYELMRVGALGNRLRLDESFPRSMSRAIRSKPQRPRRRKTLAMIFGSHWLNLHTHL